MKIDAGLIEEYQRNGAVCLRGVFDEHWLELALGGIEKTLASPSRFSEKMRGPNSDGYYFDDYYNWQRISEFEEFGLESPAAQLVGQLMQTEYVSFYHEHVLVKDPGTDRLTPWHHDQSYYPIDGDKVCSIWMPVDPVAKESSVQFVAGSHRWGWFHPIKFSTDLPYRKLDSSPTERTYAPVPEIDKSWKILSWDLRPGDCIVFHMRTLHGAPGNASTTLPRRVLATRWLGDDAVIATRPWTPSPPHLGGLKPGDKTVNEHFPIVWRRDSVPFGSKTK